MPYDLYKQHMTYDEYLKDKFREQDELQEAYDNTDPEDRR